jgi:uncharacterized protein YdhG (YjbR/CyaY superfamily)
VPDRFATIDDYIGSFPDGVQVVLDEVRRRIRGVLPDAEEAIRYDIPTFRVDGRSIVHFAGWKQHISVYPVPAGDEAFQREIQPYRSGRGTLKFPLDRPIPYDLIERVASRCLRRPTG